MGISRQRQVEVHRVHPLIMALALFLALLLETYLPLKIHWTRLVDLPLLVTIYFALLRRDKVFGVILGTGLGIIEDALSHHYLGMYGMAKALVGYLAAASSVRFNLDALLPRIILTSVFVVVHNLFFIGLEHLPENAPPFVLSQFALSVAANVGVALIVFQVLDRFKTAA